ncbi:MAG: lysostaphin resistance A-like protein [Akkermansiaceae bacterium]
MIALFCFILGIWIWDNYFGEKIGYAPGTQEAALIKMDRDLKLAEAMADDPPLLRWLAHAQTLSDAIDHSMLSLETLAESQSLGPAGFEAYAALFATKTNRNPEAFLQSFGVFQVDTESTTWWSLKLSSPDFTYPTIQITSDLRTRAVIVGSLIWLLGLVGLIFIPSTLRCLRRAFTVKSKGYSSAWSPSLGLLIFLVATLAWIGLSMVIEIGIAHQDGVHPVVIILLDTCLRVLPALIALGFLFKKVSHISRSLGLNGHINPQLILGLFSILVVVDQFLRWALLRFTPTDPTGGLSFADSGVFGLIFLIISACLIAPIAEEILYRGILFRSLANKMGVFLAALLSSTIFATLHFYDYYGLVSVATFGFFCALLYQSTGSLPNVIALHILYNTSITLPEWTIYHAPL